MFSTWARVPAPMDTPVEGYVPYAHRAAPKRCSTRMVALPLGIACYGPFGSGPSLTSVAAAATPGNLPAGQFPAPAEPPACRVSALRPERCVCYLGNLSTLYLEACILGRVKK
jgi:hypothetical protein